MSGDQAGKATWINQEKFFTARQAASVLGIGLPTLYSYVSRGMLRSFVKTGSRVRSYPKVDVARLIDLKEMRRDPTKAAARGLYWGSPVLESALTLIHQDRLFYRGQDAIHLAEHSTVEEVAALLWTGDSGQSSRFFSSKSVKPPAKVVSLLKQIQHLGPIERCQQVLSLAADDNLDLHELETAPVAKCGARILSLLFWAVCGGSIASPLDAALTRAWLPKRASAAPALRAALILCADHELNVSAFTARCIASSRATPSQVVLGGLAALGGHRHGRASGEIISLFQSAEGTSRHRQFLARHLRVFEYIPGFGHPLYPDGDPRARLLISLARMHGKKSELALADSLIRTTRALTGESPNLDFGLVTLSRALDLPEDAPVALFALGRTIGWIAHAIEQYADSRLIRPRAHYVGPPPASS